jgi:GTP cyclohydrolase I
MNVPMPDIAHSTLPQSPRRLEKVGMSRVDVPIMIAHASAGSPMTMVQAQAGGFVSLDDPEARGIHMSRIYGILATELPSRPLDFEHLSGLLDQLLESHQGISRRAEITIRYSHIAAMPALLSGREGWRRYPVFFRATKTRGGPTSVDFGIRVTYSSTCPCSAALARQLNQQRFLESFPPESNLSAERVARWLGEENNTGGEPHAQRSHGMVVLRFNQPRQLPATAQLAAHLEKTLGTPVQTAVKREDEQEFARLNARNLMFSEDAARKLAECLESYPCDDFLTHVTHFESLHPYDVQATAIKGVPDGLSQDDVEAVTFLIEGLGV